MRSCGAKPIEAIGKISVSSPMSVIPSTTTDAPSTHRWPIRTSAPMTQCGAHDRPAPDPRAGVHDRRRVHGRRTRFDGQQEPCLGDDLVADIRARLRKRQSGTLTPQRDLEAQHVAGDDGPAESAAVHAA